MRFEGKTVVVTGVGRAGQVGEYLARAFAERGATVVMLGRSAKELAAREGELAPLGLKVSAVVCDLADAASLEQAVAQVKQRHGDRVDALVHAAGGFAMSGPVGESDVSVWDRQLSINLRTAYLTTRAFLPMLRAARGAIVFFASAAALPGAAAAGMSAYAVAKAGTLTLMRAVAAEEQARGVRANALAPASIRTASNVAAMGENGGYVTLDAVADAVMFLVSVEARAVTGQVIPLTS